MRGTAKLTLLVTSAGLLAAAVAPQSSSAQSAPPPSDPRAGLVSQLSSLNTGRAGAMSQFLASEQALANLQQQLADARRRLAAANAQLQSLSRHIADDQQTMLTARSQLASMLRATYETGGQDGFAGAIISSESFSQAVDRLQATQRIASELTQLQHTVADREAALVRERAALQTQFAAAQAQEARLSQQNNQLMAAVAQRDASMRSLNWQARGVATQLASLDQGSSGPADHSGPCGNHFSYGQCTYYVATRRCIPWFGNAGQWLSAARSYGYAEGHYPQVGAVAVWHPGAGGASSYGHVAYVEAVGPDGGVPAGSFLISEMNWGGWNRVSRRVLSDNDPAIAGFIYGKAD